MILQAMSTLVVQGISANDTREIGSVLVCWDTSVSSPVWIFELCGCVCLCLTYVSRFKIYHHIIQKPLFPVWTFCLSVVDLSRNSLFPKICITTDLEFFGNDEIMTMSTAGIKP